MNQLNDSRQAGATIEITPAMVEAGVKALYAELGYQLEGSPSAGVEAVISAAIRKIDCVTPVRCRVTV